MSSSTPAVTAAILPRAPRRLRPWALLLAISIGWKVIVLTLGVAVPRWLIGDGLDNIPLTARSYAEQAKVTAMGLWSHPIERFALVQATRVIRVDSVASAGGVAAHGDGCSRAATVRAYTYFAIPYSEVRTVCDTGVVEYRVFRRKR